MQNLLTGRRGQKRTDGPWRGHDWGMTCLQFPVIIHFSQCDVPTLLRSRPLLARWEWWGRGGRCSTVSAVKFWGGMLGFCFVDVMKQQARHCSAYVTPSGMAWPWGHHPCLLPGNTCSGNVHGTKRSNDHPRPLLFQLGKGGASLTESALWMWSMLASCYFSPSEDITHISLSIFNLINFQFVWKSWNVFCFFLYLFVFGR